MCEAGASYAIQHLASKKGLIRPADQIIMARQFDIFQVDPDWVLEAVKQILNGELKTLGPGDTSKSVDDIHDTIL
jgi:hypothetical protein